MSLVATFDEVVDAQSSHYAVPAVVIVSIVKKVQNFFKVVSLVMDKKKNRMWCEAVGPQTDMETLQKSLPAGKIVFFKSLCYKLQKAVYGLKQAHLAWLLSFRDHTQRLKRTMLSL